MRVSIDIDTNSLEKLHEVFYEGFCLLGSIPEVRTGNTKGFHLIWRGVRCSQQESLMFRYLLGDDWNRLRLDLSSKKRLKQVLFTEKEINWNGKVIKGRSIIWKRNSTLSGY